MNKKEQLVGQSAYISPKAELLTLASPLSFLENGFSADLDGDIYIDDIDDVGEL